MTGLRFGKWLKKLFGHTPTEESEPIADGTESERPEPRTESELAVKAPSEDVPDVSNDESDRSE